MQSNYTSSHESLTKQRRTELYDAAIRVFYCENSLFKFMYHLAGLAFSQRAKVCRHSRRREQLFIRMQKYIYVFENKWSINKIISDVSTWRNAMWCYPTPSNAVRCYSMWRLYLNLRLSVIQHTLPLPAYKECIKSVSLYHTVKFLHKFLASFISLCYISFSILFNIPTFNNQETIERKVSRTKYEFSCLNVCL